MKSEEAKRKRQQESLQNTHWQNHRSFSLLFVHISDRANNKHASLYISPFKSDILGLRTSVLDHRVKMAFALPFPTKNICPLPTYNFRIAKFAKQSYSPFCNCCSRYSVKTVRFCGLYLSTPEINCSICSGLVEGVVHSDTDVAILKCMMMMMMMACKSRRSVYSFKKKIIAQTGTSLIQKLTWTLSFQSFGWLSVSACGAFERAYRFSHCTVHFPPFGNQQAVRVSRATV